MDQKGTEQAQSEFSLRLSESLKLRAADMEEKEGVPLADFILLAITEKIVRSE